jgi:hypothetical protein
MLLPNILKIDKSILSSIKDTELLILNLMAKKYIFVGSIELLDKKSTRNSGHLNYISSMEIKAVLYISHSKLKKATAIIFLTSLCHVNKILSPFA